MINIINKNCLNTSKPYLLSEIYRLYVPENLISWNVSWSDYNPPDYTAEIAKNKVWSDDLDVTTYKWNTIDGNVNRKSYHGTYDLSFDGRPLNPIGRTGLKGRGILGRWGPNHAADPIITRILDNKLQFIGIQRKDTEEWALPGGMVDPGEKISQTLKREFIEETLNNVSNKNIEQIFNNGVHLYSGYVDDHRNTDNSWIETSVYLFHDKDNVLKNTTFNAGDDAKNVKWITYTKDLSLYADHKKYILLAFDKLFNNKK
uniref:Nudix hydrolase domain-containing protein n=1 Tax=Parastrongyloides trichosuri TaxID=131310 RepID=A0A0N4ZMD1_PARTI